ncbi:MAG: PhoH family protein [Calditrichaeota bacterium]|nr:MAG: PhoH family protein [Calditrichota bacterium]MBL1206715.1 PhoH family protein [Calditrichota bacterium]NOG46541.1 PhoH family protein [Calditrichota bacterium]
MEKLIEKIFTLDPKINAVSFYGKNEEFIILIEQSFSVRIIPRGSEIKLIGEQDEIDLISNIFSDISETLKKNKKLTSQDVLKTIQIYSSQLAIHNNNQEDGYISKDLSIQTLSKTISPKSEKQEKFIESMIKNDLVFAIGPAGTGKTYLAVAMAVNNLKNGKIKKIVLSRPAVEAGESLGFLPGDFKEKIDPYLKPLYDALSEMIPKDALKKYFSYDNIEVLPLAYMRGRTLNNAFVILDEAQNSTFMQMKMFLTRLGKNSKAVVTGDITQVDLDSSKKSGLISSINILKDVSEIDFVEMSENDVFRHPLVKEIIDAYDRFSSEDENQDNK